MYDAIPMVKAGSRMCQTMTQANCKRDRVVASNFMFALPCFAYRAFDGSEQSQSAGSRYGVSAGLYGELDEDAFDVGLHGLGSDLQLLGDTFVGKSTANRAQDAVFARS